LGEERQGVLVVPQPPNRAKEQFLATLSHELRTPLNAILGWVHLLRSGTLDDGKVKHAYDVIERNAGIQTRLVEDILDVSRILAGRVRLSLEPTDIAGPLHAAVEAVRPAAAAKQIDLRVAVSACPPVAGDAARLQQVVGNLLGNAVKFTPAGGRVAVQVAHAEGRVRIVVSDTGCGIPAEFLPRLFQPFQQADASSTRRYGGMGLGLSVAKLLVEMHGGTLEVASVAGEGTTVTLTVPSTAQTAPAAGVDTTPSAAELRLDGVRVLVVDDHADTLEFVSTLLKERGAAVVSAPSVDEALVLFHREKPDVLITDLEMPDRSGLELLKTVRGLPPEAGGLVPAAAFTAHARAEDRDGTLAAGFQAHLTKPVRPEELVEVVSRLTWHAPGHPASAVDAPSLLPDVAVVDRPRVE
jgi:CheY-like chemotaxis protein